MEEQPTLIGHIKELQKILDQHGNLKISFIVNYPECPLSERDVDAFGKLFSISTDFEEFRKHEGKGHIVMEKKPATTCFIGLVVSTDSEV